MPSILRLSHSQVWEEAQREWSYDGDHKVEGDPDYPDKCAFCGTWTSKTMHRVCNPASGAEAWVGANCVQNVLLLQGAETMEDSARLFQQRFERRTVMNDLRALGDEILKRELTPDEVRRLRWLAGKFLGHPAIGRDLKPEEWDALVEAIAGAPRALLPGGDVQAIRKALWETKAGGAVRKARPDSGAIRGTRRVDTTFARGSHTKAPGT